MEFDVGYFTDARACVGARVRHLIANAELVGNMSRQVDAVTVCGRVSMTGYTLDPRLIHLSMCRLCLEKAQYLLTVYPGHADTCLCQPCTFQRKSRDIVLME